ncbi:MAG: ParA family protein [Thermogutta sp.]|nr:ParA family protein [Thermogutta sp.]
MTIDTRPEAKDILPLPTSQATPSRANSDAAYLPSLEVDAFLIPPICREMADQLGSTALAPVAQALASAARRGCAMGGFLGLGPASGCTTATLSTALLLADRGKRVLLVDAADNAALTSLLGLDLEHGWDTARDQSLRELVIRSLEDRFDLLPKSTLPAPNKSRPGSVSETQGRPAHPLWRRLAELTSHYAFILIDLGSEAAERRASQRVPEGNGEAAAAPRRTADETDLAAACDVLFFLRDARRGREAHLAQPPSPSPTTRPRTYIIENFAPGA